LNKFWHFYHDEISQPPNEQGPVVTNNEIGPLVPSETRLLSSDIKICQAISLINLLIMQHENQLNLNYLIFNVIFNIIDNLIFLTYELLTRVT
jgi:hypothetical protein